MPEKLQQLLQTHKNLIKNLNQIELITICINIFLLK